MENLVVKSPSFVDGGLIPLENTGHESNTGAHSAGCGAVGTL